MSEIDVNYLAGRLGEDIGVAIENSLPSRRDLFAAMFFQGMLSNPEEAPDNCLDKSIEDAISFADLLIISLDKEK